MKAHSDDIQSLEKQQEIVDTFDEFADAFGEAIWESKPVLASCSKVFDEVTCPEQIIALDVIQICSSMYQSVNDPPSLIVNTCLDILRRFDEKSDFNLTATDDSVRMFLSQNPSTDLQVPITVRALSEFDRVYGTDLARKSVGPFVVLIGHLHSPFLAAVLDDPDSTVAATRIANEYLEILNTVLEFDSANGCRDDASEVENYIDDCPECAEAYSTLELPNGAGTEEIRRAKIELAKNLHPDVWVNRRGARAAEEQLKKVNAACDHLLRCRPQCVTRESPRPDVNPDASGTDEHENIERSEKAAAPTGWRAAKVFLRTVWRVAKITLAICLIVIMAAVVLLGLFMALWRHWEREASSSNEASAGAGGLNTRLLSFLEDVTWLPRTLWGGLMILITPLVLALVLATDQIVGGVENHAAVSLAAVCLIGLSVALWVAIKEWKAEFAASSIKRSQNTTSWVMGLLIVAALSFLLFWSRPIRESVYRFASQSFAAPTSSSPQESPTVPDSNPPVSGGTVDHLLWDSSRGSEGVQVSEDAKEKLRSAVGAIAHHESEMTFGPTLSGSFYRDAPSGRQRIYTASISWLNVEGRAHAQGDLCYVVVGSGEQFGVYEADGGCTVLKVIHPENSESDLILTGASWGSQGENSEILRLWSIADHTLRLVTDIGEASVDTCASDGPDISITSQKIYYRNDGAGSISISQRKKSTRPCRNGPPSTGRESGDAR